MRINESKGPSPDPLFLLRVQVDTYDAVRAFSGVVFIEGLFDGDKQRLTIGGKQQAVGIGRQRPAFLQRVAAGVKANDLAGFTL